MRWKALLLTLSALLLLLLVGGIILLILIHREPAMYRAAEVPPGPQRVAQAAAFEAEVQEFLYAHAPGKRARWKLDLTQEQINSYLAEDFPDSSLRQELPEEIHEPRVIVRDDALHIAFRYGEGYWSTVVTLELRLRIPDSSENVLELELRDLKAGSISLSTTQARQELTEWASGHGLCLEWREGEEGPVARLSPHPEGPHACMTFSEVRIEEGKMHLGGGSSLGSRLASRTRRLFLD